MSKFEPKGNRGILVGYRLHNGGKWAHDYLVFPLHYFDDYDYNRPRSLLELIPVTTQEVKMVGDLPCFSLKPRYDAFRNYPASTLPICIIRDAAHYSCDELEDKPGS